jgi:glutamate-1-semialdehyde 2,1-aminomutase
MLADHADTTACLILEPVMMNIGLVEPEPGYLESIREICTRRGVVLIFDEVKSGATVAPGGATERYGVQPDLACFAKAICGGTPGAAFGGRADLMDVIAHGAAQQGTFNGNPLIAAAGLAALTEIMTPDAYIHLNHLGTRLANGMQRAIDEHDIPAYTVDLGGKGAICFARQKLRNYRDFLATNDALYEASYPWAVNRGIFMTPGNEEQWTISVQHTDADIDRYVDVFSEFCAALH